MVDGPRLECNAARRRTPAVRRFGLGAVVCAVVLAACTKKETSSPAAPPPSVSASASVASTPTPPNVADASAPVSAWPPSLPVPTLPSAAPAVVDGYPAPIRTCLPDPAYLVGFTSDGTEFGYCHHGMGTDCTYVDASGAQRVEQAGGPDPDDRPKGGKTEKDVDKAARDVGFTELKNKDCTLTPPPLKGTFRYGDIKLKVIQVEGSITKIGGSVGGGPAVYPYIFSKPAKMEYSNGTSLNDLALSPDGTEIGIVTHTNCMEWCDIFDVVRMPVDRFAAGIYNDAGFASYKAKDLESARDLFLRAAYLDPTRDLPAYNLACVYARQHDASHAEAALKLAIGRGGPAVKTRARIDKDFAEMKDQAWFTTLVAD